jgi:hypothetical protein
MTGLFLAAYLFAPKRGVVWNFIRFRSAPTLEDAAS